MSNNNNNKVVNRNDDIGQGQLYSPDYAIQVQQPDSNTSTTMGQGKLYSPDYAIPVQQPNNNNTNIMQSFPDPKGYVVLLTTTMMGMIKERLMGKLKSGSVPDVPPDTLENAQKFLEMVSRDVNTATQGIMKDALHRIKSHLLQILPSLTPQQASKMVDDVEREVAEEAGKATNQLVGSRL